MIKNIIAPIQAWLLAQKRCVGCGTPLEGARKEKKARANVVICKCNRIYILDNVKKIYRRAKLEEV